MKMEATHEKTLSSASESTLTTSETDDDESSSSSSSSSGSSSSSSDSVEISLSSEKKMEGETYYQADDVDWVSQLRSSPIYKYRYEDGRGPEAADDQVNGRPGSRSSQVSSGPSSLTSYYMDGDGDDTSETQSAMFCTPPESSSPLPEGNWSAPNFPRMPPEGEESASVYHVSQNNSSDDLQKLTLTPLSKSCSTSYMSDSEISSTTKPPAIKVHRTNSNPGPTEVKYQPIGARFLSQHMSSLSSNVGLSLYSSRSRSRASPSLPIARGSKYV